MDDHSFGEQSRGAAAVDVLFGEQYYKPYEAYPAAGPVSHDERVVRRRHVQVPVDRVSNEVDGPRRKENELASGQVRQRRGAASGRRSPSSSRWTTAAATSS